MRKRRLYRHAMRRAQQVAHEAVPQDNPNWERSVFESGMRHGMRIASMQQRQHAIALASHSESRVAVARRDGFDSGYSAGLRAGREISSSTQNQGTYTYSDVEAARRRGIEEGKKRAAKSVGDESSFRKKIVADMLEQCRVVSESNPNMAPGVNAVRHMIKKLG